MIKATISCLFFISILGKEHRWVRGSGPSLSILSPSPSTPLRSVDFFMGSDKSATQESAAFKPVSAARIFSLSCQVRPRETSCTRCARIHSYIAGSWAFRSKQINVYIANTKKIDVYVANAMHAQMKIK